MKRVLAVVGMPGSGKSEAVEFFKNKGIPSVRFGDLTDQTLKNLNMERNEANEKLAREQLRKEKGMAVYAVFSKPKIGKLLSTHNMVVLDGLYSWEEYRYLLKEFKHLVLLAVYASPSIRYERLAKRLVRPLTVKESRKRDVAEIEYLNKGGPIALCDYLIRNETTKEKFYQKLKTFISLLENDSL
ncbi:MAG: hypothetical protein A3D75_02910 [Candidatus Levybacteria bacterium RIFCSPHIGHO2_02_FULL_37_18]|nr:MAG: hypothetical protein A3D75_02910 [Candidatus Levybacteria bacterium RIFCSPHIGHO2_02_FULL_37_18]